MQTAASTADMTMRRRTPPLLTVVDAGGTMMSEADPARDDATAPEPLVAAAVADALDAEGPAMTDLRRALRSDHGDPELGVQGRETATRLAAAIASLGTKDRLLVELHLVRGASLPAVAEALGATANAAYVRKSR